MHDKLAVHAVSAMTDRLGNVIARSDSNRVAPRVMVFAHRHQVGFVVRKVDRDGPIRVERLGGLIERSMAAHAVQVCGARGDIAGVIMN